MDPEKLYKEAVKYVSLILVCAVVFAFAARVGSFAKKHPLTFDESVYAALAAQIGADPGDYNTMGIYRNALSKGTRLPEYFNKPLFKHPPLFARIISFSYRISGKTYFSAFKVSLFSGVLLIVMAYLLGACLFDKETGVCAAVIASIEPVTWITSQKIWMETTLAFFMVLALYLFARGLKKYNPYFFLSAGVAAGLAALVKYPGMLAAAVMFLYALCCDRRLFRTKFFILSLFIPFIMLIPWMEWNYRIYGAEFFTQQTASHREVISFLARSTVLVKVYWIYAAALSAAAALLAVIGRKYPSSLSAVSGKFRSAAPALAGISIAVILFALGKHIVNSLDFFHVPEAGWKIGMFSKEPWYFYLGRLPELSPFFIFSYAALAGFVFDRPKSKQYALLFLYCAGVLLFWILWKNYQCRYIAGVVVPLVVLSARTLVHGYGMTAGIASEPLRRAARALIILLAAFAAAKTLRIDLILAVPNGTCYF